MHEITLDNKRRNCFFFFKLTKEITMNVYDSVLVDNFKKS